MSIVVACAAYEGGRRITDIDIEQAGCGAPAGSSSKP
jgi:hypothetical protein